LPESMRPESVHLCEYPQVNDSFVDEGLSRDMDALLRLVTLGSAARNLVKIKVRQPLAELVVQTNDEAESNAISRFRDQLCEELNIKQVTHRSPAQGPLLKAVAKLNKKSAAPKLGPKLKEGENELPSRDAVKLAETLRNGSIELAGVELDSADIVVEYVAAEGWAGVADHGTQVALDARLTEELKAEGMAREIVRFVQDARKMAGLDLADKIALYLETESAILNQAIITHREFIEVETQVVKWLQHPPDGATPTAVKIDGQGLKIVLQKV